MRHRCLLGLGLCAAAVLGVRGLAARPAKAATLVHVAELAGGNLRAEISDAQSRYLHSQPRHWRECVIKK